MEYMARKKRLVAADATVESSPPFRLWLFEQFDEWRDELNGRSNWTQFAQYLGIPYSVVTKWKNGETKDGVTRYPVAQNSHVVQLSNKLRTNELYRLLHWEIPECF